MTKLNLPADTPILAMDSPTFAEDFRKALGLQPGEPLEIMTPQFERTDGMQVPVPDLSIAEFRQLTTRDEATLKALGFGVWGRDDKETHWLYPKEWYARIPEGLEIVYIDGTKATFRRGETNDDYRFGLLAFGFLQPLGDTK